MNAQFHSRVARIRKGLAIAFSIAALSLAVPTDSYAQGMSSETPVAEQGKGKGKQDGGSTVPVPEPATWATLITLAVLGGGLAYRSMKRRQEIAD